jgi:hypothetical protein
MSQIIDFITSKTFIAIATAFLTWILKGIYDKFWRIRPKLYVSISQPLFSQRNEQYQYFSFGWRQTIKIKNNSKFTAYNIDLVFPEGFNLSDKQPISNFLKKNNHLDSNQEMEFEVESMLRIPAEEHLKYEIESDGTKVMLPGVKNPNPQDSLMPEKVKKVKFYLKYENEKGSSFYTKFTKENKNEINSLRKFKPKI